MLTLADKGLIPPGGWRFEIDGTTVVGSSYVSLFNTVMDFADTHGVEVPPVDTEQWFQDQLCRQNTDIQCEVVAPVTNATRVVSAGDALRFLKVLKNWLSSGAHLVPQAEAERRSEICAQCPLNIEITGCSSCMGIASKIFELTGGRRTRFDNQLKGCGACGCVNRSQVWVPLDVLAKGVSPEMKFPEACWKREALALFEGKPRGDAP
jgi:hypothetical protein